ncbi:MAG: DnaJ domain-containing protein [Helicobacteraceae bacterium]|nr:DnaJ domain-containing protein [Helicobacteraceae bacterium]
MLKLKNIGSNLNAKTLLGIAIIALGIFLEVMWLGVCFGTVVIGIILLIFAPGILFFPFNFFLVLGLSVMKGRRFEYKYSGQSRSYSQNNSFSQVFNNLDDHYKTLESSSTDEMDVIKKNYRRLIKEYHYDSIASQNLSDKMIELAKEKTQALNEAYSAIKSARSKSKQ